MSPAERIEAFSQLGTRISRFLDRPDEKFLQTIYRSNPWFIKEFVLTALEGILKFLDPDQLNLWFNNYLSVMKGNKSVGIIMPGNIPLAGFHDMVCVLISGNKALIKPSHQDRLLIEFIADQLTGINSRLHDNIIFIQNLSQADGIIATGSDNTARYFRYYYKNLPAIIRKNRTSCCILNGHETREELSALADDIFLYFGLGCRNVSKLYIPESYPLEILREHFLKYSWLIQHDKYANNFKYRKSLILTNGEEASIYDHFIFRYSEKLVSPIAEIYFQHYRNKKELMEGLEIYKHKIQCIVAHPEENHSFVPFGKAQFPDLDDYPDGMNTLDFLAAL